MADNQTNIHIENLNKGLKGLVDGLESSINTFMKTATTEQQMEFAKQMQSSNATEIIEKIKQTVNQK